MRGGTVLHVPAGVKLTEPFRANTLMAQDSEVPGILRALREHPRHVVTVCTELTAERRQALVDGVIDLVFGTPLARISTTGAIPERSLRFDPGQCSTFVPAVKGLLHVGYTIRNALRLA